MRKLTYKYVKNYIESFGYKVKSTEYVNAQTPIKIQCDKNHDPYYVRYYNFQQGKRCPYCVGNKKHALKYIKEQFAKEGYRLLSTEYKNNSSKLETMCPRGHKYNVTYGHFKNGCRCLICSGNKKYTYNKVEEYFNKFGYSILSKEYKNNYTKLDLLCPKGHIFKMSFKYFKNGRRCPACQGLKKYTIKEIKNILKKDGYILLSTEYKNAHTKLRTQCPEGHKYKVVLNAWLRGNRCSICAGNKKHSYSYIKKFVEKRKYILLSTEYINIGSKLMMQCPEGHIFKMRFDHFKNGSECPICSCKSSKAEKEIFNIAKSFTDKTIIENDRTQILNQNTGRKLELDLWIPSLNKAIEFNGTYWHSDKKVIKRDQIKKDQCLSKGIDLLVIQEQDYIKNKQDCINNIKDFIQIGG